MKIGVYGGTFNPPHLGHVTAARAVSELLKLDKLLFIPAGQPPHKALPAGSPTPEQRLEMTRLAAEQLGLGDRVRRHWTWSCSGRGGAIPPTRWRQLRQQYPEDELWLLMGTDMFLTIQTWHEPEKISVPGGDRRLRPDGGGHGGAVLRPAGLSVPDLSQGPDLHPDHPRRDGRVLHRAARALLARGRGRRTSCRRRCTAISCGRVSTAPGRI